MANPSDIQLLFREYIMEYRGMKSFFPPAENKTGCGKPFPERLCNGQGKTL